MATEFITARINVYEQRLTENLQQYGPQIVTEQNETASSVEATTQGNGVVDNSHFVVTVIEKPNHQSDVPSADTAHPEQ